MSLTKCNICGQEFRPANDKIKRCPECEHFITLNGKIYRRIPFGEEPVEGIDYSGHDIADYSLPTCPECGADKSKYHFAACHHEICPACLHIHSTCDCYVNAEWEI